MRILHSTARYFPDESKLGGLQTHVQELAVGQIALGHNVKVAASIDDRSEEVYCYDGVEVYRYPVYPEPLREPNYGRSRHGYFRFYEKWFRRQDLDVYHQHQWTPKCGWPHLKLATQKKGVLRVISVHVPLPICRRGTLMYNNCTQCDGRIIPERCCGCLGVKLDIYKSIASRLMPGRIVDCLARFGSSSPNRRTAISKILIPRYVEETKRGLGHLVENSDLICVACNWLKEALIENGVSPQKILLNRYGIAKYHQKCLSAAYEKYTNYQSNPKIMRVGFFGRWTEDKGCHILVDAFQKINPMLDIQLVLHCIPQDSTYEAKIRKLIGSDLRITIHSSVINLNELSDYIGNNCDVVAVPSQWLETGPLIVLHANAAGVPVIGSNLGGIRELIRDGVDGILITHNDSGAWSVCIKDLFHNKETIHKLRARIKPVKTAEQQAAELLEAYERCRFEKLSHDE